MFYYYGRKQKIFGKYPKPKHDLIIEPFAGSAAYSMNYHERNVILIEKDKRIADLWSYLINVDRYEILSLPLLSLGQSLNDNEFSYLTDVQKSLIGFFLNPGSAQPKKSPGKFCGWNEKNRLRLSEDVTKVSHWTIINGDYRDVDNHVATWYIDPPYQGNGGQYYKHGNNGFDYNDLRNWVLDRNGQTIVCENSEADWMDFKPLVNIQGQRHKTTEVIYYQEKDLVENIDDFLK
jgi:site-specific DNA-adenine methylase